MARTGRFGRLPTAAPDLSGQIVSLMEQWQNAEDRNILDAWTNGGRYKGKKVKDGDILQHYRKRRNGYDKDDPEWDQWNQDLWQMRYQISDEKVQMAYRMGKIGPAAVARHYRSWARKMPKNSSYYRNLMATAGDFAKTAAASGAAASRGFDYEAMQRRVAAIEKKQKPLTDYIGGLNEYAIARGFIPPGQSVLDPQYLNAFEAYDLAAMLDGYQASGMDTPEGHKPALRSARRTLGFTGPLTGDKLEQAVGNFVRLEKQKIREWRKSPSDYSSYIVGSRGNINNARSWLKGTKNRGYFDIGTDLAVAWDIFSGQTSERVGAYDPRRNDAESGIREEGMMGAVDPEDALSGDANFVGSLTKARNQYADLGGASEVVAALTLIIQAFQGNEEAVRKVLEMDPTITTQIFGAFSPFANPNEIAAFAQERMVLTEATGLLQTQQAVIVYTDQPSEGEMSQGAAGKVPFYIQNAERNSSGRMVLTDPATGKKTVMNDQTVIVSTKGSGNNMNPTLITGRPVKDINGETVGYQFDIRGNYSIYGRPNPNKPGAWQYLPYSPWDAVQGVSLDDRGNDGLFITGDPNFVGDEDTPTDVPVIRDLDEIVETAIDTIENTAGLSQEEREVKSGAVSDLSGHIQAGNWDLIRSDPKLREAYLIAHPEDTAQYVMYGGISEEAQEAALTALIGESARRTHGADIEYTPQDAVFVSPQGHLYDLDDVQVDIGAEGSIEGVANNRRAGDPESRQRAMDDFRAVPGNEGASYAETLAAVGGTASPMMGQTGFDPRAFAGTGDASVPDDYEPMSVMDDDPGIAEAYATGDRAGGDAAKVEIQWDVGLPTAAQAAFAADPNKEAMTPAQYEQYVANTFMGINPNDVAAQEEAVRAEAALRFASEQGFPELSQIATSGASAAAIEAGHFLGTGKGWSDGLESQTGFTNELLGLDLDVADRVGEQAYTPPPPRRSAPSAMSVGLGSVPRLDTMQPQAQAPAVAPVKPPPMLKVAANLLQGGALPGAPAKVPTVPLPPGIQGPPAPVAPPPPPLHTLLPPVTPTAPTVPGAVTSQNRRGAQPL